ncbi:hypothetical protein A2U01_0105475, partial [Trifolium medium]|nr:hypothetical protein [Trifolium medium]
MKIPESVAFTVTPLTGHHTPAIAVFMTSVRIGLFVRNLPAKHHAGFASLFTSFVSPISTSNSSSS